MNIRIQLLFSALLVFLISLQTIFFVQSKPTISPPPIKKLSHQLDTYFEQYSEKNQLDKKAAALKKEFLNKSIDEWKISAIEFSMIDQDHILPLDRECPYSLISEHGMNEIKYCNSPGKQYLYLEIETAVFPDSFILQIIPVNNALATHKDLMIGTTAIAILLLLFNLLIVLYKRQKPAVDKMKEFWKSFENILEKDNITPESLSQLPADGSDQLFWKTSLLTQINHLDSLINESIRFCPPYHLTSRQSKIEILSWDSLEVHKVPAYMLGVFGSNFGSTFWSKFNAACEENLNQILESKEIIMSKVSDNSLMLFQSPHSTELLMETLASLLKFKALTNAGFPVLMTDTFDLQMKTVKSQKFWTVRSEKLDFFTHGHFNRIQLNEKEAVIDDQLADYLYSIGSLKKKDMRKINEHSLFRVEVDQLLDLESANQGITL